MISITREAGAESERRWGGWRPGAGRPRRDDWQIPFLRAYSRGGRILHAAYRANVNPDTVYSLRNADEDFAVAMAEAKAFSVERLEREFELSARKTGNPVPYIVRLKAEAPARYIERNVTLNLSASVSDAEVSDVMSLLRGVLTSGTTDWTVRQITEGMGGGESQALPAPGANAREALPAESSSPPPASPPAAR